MMVKEPLCEPAVARTMPADQMGSRLARDLSSSTRCTVDRRHSFGRPESETSPGVTIAARSKNLDAHCIIVVDVRDQKTVPSFVHI